MAYMIRSDWLRATAYTVMALQALWLAGCGEPAPAEQAISKAIHDMAAGIEQRDSGAGRRTLPGQVHVSFLNQFPSVAPTRGNLFLRDLSRQLSLKPMGLCVGLFLRLYWALLGYGLWRVQVEQPRFRTASYYRWTCRGASVGRNSGYEK